MKKIRFSLALVLLFAMIVCATVPTFAETIANAADAKGDFDSVAFEMEAVTADGKTTMFYDKGESVTLNIALFGIKGSAKTPLTTPKVQITIDSDDGTKKVATVDMTGGLATYTFTAMNLAGWQRIRLRALDASGKDLTAGNVKEYSGGITVDKDSVATTAQKPADFESWWAKVIAEELDTCPPEVIKVEQIPSDYNYIYRVYVTAPTLKDTEHQYLKSGDTYVSFHLVFPRNSSKGSLTISAVYQGYNMGTGGYWANTGKVNVIVNAHSTTLGETHTYDELTDWEKGSAGKYGWDSTRTADRETIYYKYMLLRDLQAIRFAQLCFGPEGYNKTVDGIDFSQFRGLWDGENVHTSGSSQGGFQATAMAALCPDVTYCETSMTWLCDVAGGTVDGKVSSSFRPSRAQNTDGRYGLDYFDSAFFATMITCPYKVAVIGAGDVVAPVSGILAMYNNLDVPEKSAMFTQGRDHMTDKTVWQYHNYFGSPDESYSHVKSGGITFWKLDGGALKVNGVGTLSADLMNEFGWNDIKANVRTVHLNGFTNIGAGALNLTGSKVYAVAINSTSTKLESGAITGAQNVDLAVPSGASAASYSAAGVTVQTLKDGRYFVKMSGSTLTVCVFNGELTSDVFATEATANAASVLTLEIKGNPLTVNNLATAVGKLTACTTILFDEDAETLAPITSGWSGLFGKIDALTTIAHISDWSNPSYTAGVADLTGFEYLYADSGDAALQGLFYDCQGITKVIMPEALYLFNGKNAIKDENGQPIDISGNTYFVQFSGCKNLASIDWNGPLNNLTEGAFTNCAALTSITADSIPNTFGVFMGTSTTINGLNGAGLITITTPGGAVIGKSEGSSNNGLNAFYVLADNILKVYRLTTTAALAQAGSDVFATIPTIVDTTNVTEMHIIGSNSNSVGQIGNTFFSKMPALKTLLMDSRMDSIASYFVINARGSKLSTFAHVKFDDATSEILSDYEEGAIDTRGFKYLYTSMADRQRINTSFVANTQAEKIYLPESFLAVDWSKKPLQVDGETIQCAGIIGSAAFAGNTKLKQIVFSVPVSKIEANAFKDCTALETLDFNGGISSITIDGTAFTNVASETDKKYATANLPDSAQAAQMKKALGDIANVKTTGSVQITPALDATGVAVRTKDYTGVRSFFTFDSSVIEVNEAQGLTLAEYGALFVAQKNYEALCNSDELTMFEIASAGHDKVKCVPVYKIVNDKQVGHNRYVDVTNGAYTYCVTMTGIPEGNYKDDIFICAYVRWTDANGNDYFEFVHYTDTQGNDARSLYDVTAAAYKMGVVNSALAEGFDDVIWPVLSAGAVTVDGFKYLDVPYYGYKWYSNKEYTKSVTNVNASLNYYPGDDTPTETGIIWSLIEYGDEYIATYRLADGADPMLLPRLTYSGAGPGYTVYQPFDYRFNGAEDGKNYAALDTLSPTLPKANANLVKTLVLDSGITGGNSYALSNIASLETIVLSSDFDTIHAGMFHNNNALKTVFEAGNGNVLADTIDLSSVATISSASWLFTGCNAAESIKFSAGVSLKYGYGTFRDCKALERVWVDGNAMPKAGTIDLGAASVLNFDSDAFKNAYLINTIVFADDTSFTSNEWLAKALSNTGKNNPYNANINVNLVYNEDSAAEKALTAQSITGDIVALKLGLNGVVLTNEGDIEVDIGGLVG